MEERKVEDMTVEERVTTGRALIIEVLTKYKLQLSNTISPMVETPETQK